MASFRLATVLFAGLALSWPATARAAPPVYVANFVGGTVSVIDTATNTVTASVLVGFSPVTVAVHPAGTRIYVTDFFEGVSVIDTASNTVVTTVPVRGAAGAAVHPNGTRLYVASFSDVVVIDTATNSVVTSVQVQLGGAGATGVAVHPDGTRVYVVNSSLDGIQGGTVSVIDTASNTVTARIRVPGGGNFNPKGIALHPAGTRLYVVNSSSFDGTVSVIDAATNTVVATVPAGSLPSGVAVHPDGTRVYVSSADRVLVIDTVTNTVTTTIPLTISLSGVAVDPAGMRIYVANEGRCTLSVIDAATNIVTARVLVGHGAQGVAVGSTSVPGISVPAASSIASGTRSVGEVLTSGVARAKEAGVAKFVFTSIPSPQTAGVPFTFQIIAQDTAGNTVTSFQSPGIFLNIGATLSSSGPFVNGVMTGPLGIVIFHNAGLGQRITVVSGPGEPTGISNPIDVLPGPAKELTFVVEPRAVSAGSVMPGPPTVVVRDDLCNVVTQNVPITVRLTPRRPQVNLSGTLTRGTEGGVAAFNDLAVNLPGQYSLFATAPGLLSEISSAFTVVEAGTIPALLNNTLTTLRPGVATNFSARDTLSITTRSGIDFVFSQPSTLALQSALTGELQLASGFVNVRSEEARLALAVPQGRISSLVGSADASVSVSGGTTTLEVHSGVADLVALGQPVPPGGRMVIDAAGNRTTELTLTQGALVVTPEIMTKIALANPTEMAASVTLTARNLAGALLTSPRNPQTVTLPPGGALHETAATLFGLGPNTTTLGTLQVRTTTLGVRATSVLEMPAQGVAIGVGIDGQRASEVVLPERAGVNFLLLHNPGSVPLTLTLTRFDVLGVPAGEATLTLAAQALVIKTTSELFGPFPDDHRGRIVITAANRFVAHNVALGQTAAAFAGQGPTGLSPVLRAPLIVEAPGVATTTLMLLNPSATAPVRVALTLRDRAGQPLGTVVDTLLAGRKIERDIRSLFPGLGATPSLIGWLEVRGVPAAVGGTAQLTGAVTLRGPASERAVTLPLVAGTQTDTTAALVMNGGGFLSVMSVVNPSAEQSVSATVIMRVLDGSIVHRTTLSLGPLALGLVELPSSFTGSLQVTADGDGVVVGGLSGLSDHRFLAPLFPQ